MKKSTFFLALIMVIGAFTSQSSFAQVQKGNWLVESGIGNLSVSKTTNNYTSVSSSSKSNYLNAYLSIYPRGGYFVVNNLVIGSTLGTSFSYSKGTGYSTGIKTSTSNSMSGYIDVIPFLRYYFPTKKSGNIRFYGQVGGGASIQYFNKYKSTSYNNTGDITDTYEQKYTKPYIYAVAEILVGLNYFVSKQIAINTSIGYQYNNSFYTYNYTSTNSMGVPTTSSDTKSTYQAHRATWMVGFTYIIPGKKNKETSSTAE